MSEGVYQAATGALIQQYRMDILANNLANVQTAGFKEERTHFKLINAEPVDPLNTDAVARASLEPVLLGYPSMDYYVNFSQGPMQRTGNPLDLAIDGDGFFNIQTPNGVEYTRKGNFMLSEDGFLVTAEGFPVLGRSGKIQLGEGIISVDKDGGLHLDDSTIDQLSITRFADPQQLQKVGGARFRSLGGEASGETSETFSILQGHIELGNVDPVRGMVEMIETLRVFEAYQKVLKALDEVDSQAIGDVGSAV
jgi:flagellar basal-body rod protein FlgF